MTRTIFTLSLLCLIVLWAASSWAVPARERDKQTPGQDIYLIFHKLTGVKPDFAAALASSDKYKKADMAEREVLSANFYSKMTHDFEKMNVADTLVTVVTPVEVRTDFKGLRMNVSLVNQVDKEADIYFPYNWGGMNFAVVPDQIDSFMEVPMDGGQLNKIKEQARGYTQIMVVRMLPVSADRTSPIKLDGLKQWLILSKVVSVEYKTAQGQPIWSWADNKHARSTSSELFELKK